MSLSEDSGALLGCVAMYGSRSQMGAFKWKQPHLSPHLQLKTSLARQETQRLGASMPVRWPTIRHRSARYLGRRFLGYLSDLTSFFLAAFAAFQLRFDGALPTQYLHPMETAVCIWAGAKSMAFVICAVRWGHWRYTSTSDVVRIVLANSLGSLLGGCFIFLLFGLGSVPRSIYTLDWLVSCLLTLGARIAVRLAVTAGKFSRPESKQTRALIYGAGAAGLALVRELQQNQSLTYEVVGLLDDDPQKGDLLFHDSGFHLSIILPPRFDHLQFQLQNKQRQTPPHVQVRYLYSSQQEFQKARSSRPRRPTRRCLH